jgi:hypothetical protein
MEYDLYHDESTKAGYWHGILLVPRQTRGSLLAYLAKARSNTRFVHPIELKGLNKCTGPRYRTIRSWMSLGTVALMQDFKHEKARFFSAKDGRGPGFDVLMAPVRARFILFRVRDDHRAMIGYRDHAAKIETTFRMGLKGGLHLFSNTAQETLEVMSFHFDGHEHHKRRLDRDRIIGRLNNLREGVSISHDCAIDDDHSDHRKSGSQSYDDCQLLQLTDLLVSGFRTVLGEVTHDAQRSVSEHLRMLTTKWNEGYARMRNSRWFGGFCLSECWLDNDEWVFSDILPDKNQPSLF